MGALEVVVGLYATVLPFAVLGAWLAVALWDVAVRVHDEQLPRGGAVGWSAVVLFVPAVGAAAYLLTGASLPRWLGVTYVAGGVLAYLLVLGLAAGLSAAG
jgi:hypothetical protein